MALLAILRQVLSLQLLLLSPQTLQLTLDALLQLFVLVSQLGDLRLLLLHSFLQLLRILLCCHKEILQFQVPFLFLLHSNLQLESSSFVLFALLLTTAHVFVEAFIFLEYSLALLTMIVGYLYLWLAWLEKDCLVPSFIHTLNPTRLELWLHRLQVLLCVLAFLLKP